MGKMPATDRFLQTTRYFCVGLCLWLTPALSLSETAGITGDTIVFGQSACFTGPNKNMGNSYRNGILAAFDAQNRLGGLDGLSLQLISLDDAYEPDQARLNANRFASENDVFAVIGTVGTPTTKVIAPVLKKANIPLVGPLTGASFAGDHERYPGIINLRASYLDEIKALVDHAIQKLHKSRFGIIYQDDAFGRSVLNNYKAVLDSYSIPITDKASYSRNTHAVHSGIFSLSKADLDFILVVGGYAANATIINLVNSLGYDYVIASLSFASSLELGKEIEAHEKIFVTRVMSDVTDRSQPVVKNFRQALSSRYGQESVSMVNQVALEGYILGRYVIDVLKRMDGELTREQFLRVGLSSDPVAIDDWILKFEPGTNRGSTYVRLLNPGAEGPEDIKINGATHQ